MKKYAVTVNVEYAGDYTTVPVVTYTEEVVADSPKDAEKLAKESFEKRLKVSFGPIEEMPESQKSEVP